MLPFSLVVLTYNEEQNLEECLRSVQPCAGEMYIVDSGSTDRTLEIARQYGAQIVPHAFETHARQWDWALEHLPLNYEWVLGLDADQRVTPELAAELSKLFTTERASLDMVNGFFIKRRQVFRGTWIRHGGYYPKYLLKLFRRSSVYLDENDLIDHHFYVRGNTAKLENDLIEANRKEDDIAFWIDKHNRYAARHAREEWNKREQIASSPIRARLLGNPDERVVWLKRVWFRMPLYVRPVTYFLFRYFLRLGFLDGKQGFIFHFMQAFWYRLLVDIHLDTLQTIEREQPHVEVSAPDEKSPPRPLQQQSKPFVH